MEDEAKAGPFLSAIQSATRRLASAVTVYETSIVVVARHGPASAAEVQPFLDDLAIEVVLFAEPFITAAWQAYARSGKGFDTMARLNLSDCADYALAKILDMPLLFKGSDFGHTDLRPAI